MRVVIADDSLLLRSGLASLLTEFGHEVVGTASDVVSTMALLDADPDLVMLDLRMPPTYTTEGLQAAAAIRAERPGQAVLVLSQYVAPHQAMGLVSGDASGVGYLLKERITDPVHLHEAITRLVAGETVIDPTVVHAMFAAARADDPLAELTEREREVLALMAEGRSNTWIAEHLCLTGRTVESHVRSIFARLGLLPASDDHRRVLAVLTYLQRDRPAASVSPPDRRT